MTDEKKQEPSKNASSGNLAETVIDRLEATANGTMGNVTESIAENLDKTTKGDVSKDTTKSVFPFVAGAGGALAGVALMPAAQTLFSKLFDNISSGLRNIPLVGGMLGTVVDAVGSVTGWILPIAGGLIGYKLFDVKDLVDDTEKTAYHHVGRKGQKPAYETVTVVAPETKVTLAQEKIAVSSAAVKPLSDEVETLLNRYGISTKKQALKLRTKILSDKDKKELESALMEFSAKKSQEYENNRLLVGALEVYDGNNGARKKLVDAIKKIGFSPEQAEALVPIPPTHNNPDIRSSIYEAGNDFPKALEEFAHKFEASYGPAVENRKTKSMDIVFTVKDSSDDTTFTRKKWDDMSTSQRDEFLHKAIPFVENRKKFLDEKKEYLIVPDDLHNYVERRERYNFKDYSGMNWFERIFKDAPQGRDEKLGMTWEAEHKIINDIYSITLKDYGRTSLFTQAPTFGKMLEDWDKQQTDMAKHEETLTAAKPVLAAFKAEVETLKQNLKKIAEGELTPETFKAQPAISQATHVDTPEASGNLSKPTTPAAATAQSPSQDSKSSIATK